MTSTYKYIDHTADIAVEISGNTFEELFLAALNSWKSSIIEPSDHKRSMYERNISLEENSVEELLVSILQELNYLLEVKRIFPLEIDKITIEKKNDEYKLKCNAWFGEILKQDVIKTEIKAITFHQLEIKKMHDVYKTIIIFDI